MYRQNRGNDLNIKTSIKKVTWLERELASGILVGINIVISCLTFASLIMIGHMQVYLVQGFLIFLLSSVISSLILLFFVAEPLAIATPSNQIIAIIAILSSNISVALGPTVPLEDVFVVVIFTIAATTFLTGILFYFFGYFKIGGLIRYIPYPVITGFLAGSGYIICKCAFSLELNVPYDTLNLSFIFDSALISFIIMLSWGMITYFLVSILRSPTLFIFVIFLTIILFYGFLLINHISLDEAIARGWMLPHGEKLENIRYLHASMLNLWHLNLQVISANAIAIITAISASFISIFLNIIGVEIVTNKELDTNHQLKIAGLTNVFIGSLGGFICFISLSNATMLKKIGASSKLAPAITICVLLLVLLSGLSFISFFPKILLASILMYVGLSLILDTFIQNWLKLSFGDFLLSVFILLLIVMFGLIDGLLIGIGITALLFVFNYSQVDLVRFEIRGKSLHSNVTRFHEIDSYLEKQREKIILMKLGGFIFFGTANNLLNRIKKDCQFMKSVKPRFIILDFELVTGLDSSAMLVLSKIDNTLKPYEIVIIFTHLHDYMKEPFTTWKLSNDTPFHKTFKNNDFALEWCEEQLLKDINFNLSISLEKQLQEVTDNQTQINNFISYFEKVVILPGNILFHEGDASDSLYYIESGEITISRSNMQDAQRLSKIGAGDIVGEMGLYTNKNRFADAIATEKTVLYRLSIENFQKMNRQDSEAANLLSRIIINIMSARLAYLQGRIRHIL